MKKMIEKLRRRASKCLRENKGTDLEEKYSLIVSILKDDRCFMKMDVNEATSILLDLGIKESDVIKVYIELTKR